MVSPAVWASSVKLLNSPTWSRVDMKITSFMSGVNSACSSQAGLEVSCVVWQPAAVRRQKNSSGFIAVPQVSVYRNPLPSGAHHCVSYQCPLAGRTMRTFARCGGWTPSSTKSATRTSHLPWPASSTKFQFRWVHTIWRPSGDQ